MDGQFAPKLKLLLQVVPPGFLVDKTWLRQNAISRQSLAAYVKRGWLERVMPGLYRRPFGAPENSGTAGEWKIPLLSAQRIMGYRFHIGGASALSLHGHVHYLPLGKESTIHLYGDGIPSWLLKLRGYGRFVRHGGTLFGTDASGIEDSMTSGDGTEMPWRWPIRMSSPERAILEVLDELPNGESFHMVDTVFESLANLRPKLLMTLLKRCRSVKVKRLFFVYADKHAHAWHRHIDSSAIDLGHGDRALAPGGRLHPVYRVTVPADLMPREEYNGA